MTAMPADNPLGEPVAVVNALPPLHPASGARSNPGKNFATESARSVDIVPHFGVSETVMRHRT